MSRTHSIAWLAGAALCALFSTSAGSEGRGQPAIAKRGGFFVGGHPVELRSLPPRARIRREGLPAQSVDLNGDYEVGATYVEYTLLAKPRARWPLVMVPGGGFSAAAFQDTPDGRHGWEWEFLSRGYSVYLVDLNRTGRSPWRRFPEMETEEPSFRSNAFLWETFRLGPPGSYSQRRPYGDTKFPVAAFSQMAKQAAPRFRTSPGEEAAALDAVIRKACPCFLLLHSAAGPEGMAAARRWPDLVKAVVAVEPSGGPPENGDAVPRSPHIFVWGDHLSATETLASWWPLYEGSRRYQRKLSDAGVSTVWIDLPDRGIAGNSHMLMLDTNSHEIAGLIDEALFEAVHGSR